VNDDVSAIKKKYHKLTRKYHPDRDDSPEAREIIHRINMAKAVLCDADSRQLYDIGRYNSNQQIFGDDR